jgi:hypothetical protein
MTKNQDWQILMYLCRAYYSFALKSTSYAAMGKALSYAQRVCSPWLARPCLPLIISGLGMPSQTSRQNDALQHRHDSAEGGRDRAEFRTGSAVPGGSTTGLGTGEQCERVSKSTEESAVER